MAFNVDEYLAAIEVPEITIDGTTYTGRLPSLNEVATFMKQYQGIITSTDLEEQAKAAEAFFSLLDLPIEKITVLPFKVQEEALNYFFALVVNQMTTQ